MISHICQIVLGQTSELAQVLLHVHVVYVSDQIGSTTDRKRVHSCIHIYCGMLILWMHGIEFFILSFFPFLLRRGLVHTWTIMKRKKNHIFVKLRILHYRAKFHRQPTYTGVTYRMYFCRIEMEVLNIRG